ncbi:hypothetical protein R6Q59_008232 [Mikania micrantha]|uniref:Protein kinase domain-containing protein n=1 Tax=Mikania micrantha TaxID=192012 RepID=A0A5N6Q493_9ASTR|nr:hypothetical protein E3N88_02538 [Mikania micrantha]
MHTTTEWIRGQVIGHGSFGKVSLAKPTSQSSQFPPLMAVKSCSSSRCASLKNEFMILDQLKDCPEIIKCYGDCFTVENGEKLYNVALEYASGGSLADKVKNSENSRFLESDVRRYTKSILKGLQFIHRKKVVHCDIKPQNVLLFPGDNVKIADFGLAKSATVPAVEFKSGNEIRGSPMYLAPETVTGGVQEPASDVWAVGCLVTEMLTGKPAWSCSDIGALFMKIGVGAEIPDIPGKLSEAGKDFLGKCFVKDTSKRWTAEMLLKHPFIDGEDRITPSSPRNPFDFPDWESEQMITVTPFCSPESGSESWNGVKTRVSTANRLRQMMTQEVPDWSDSSGWVTVR